jgi:hypothetical protein
VQGNSFVHHLRAATRKPWLAAALIVLLLLAGSFAVTHPYDSAAHTNGQPCSACLSAASFSAGAVTTPVHTQIAIATPVVALVVVTALFSVVPTRRYARGPPVVSFTF